MIRDNPAFAIRLLSLTGEPGDTDLPAWLEDSVFNDRLSTDFPCDKAVVIGSVHDPVRGIIVEAEAVTAEFYTGHFPTSLPGYVFPSRALYPSQVPVLADPAAVAADPRR
jgi:hypothetical protein